MNSLWTLVKNDFRIEYRNVSQLMGLLLLCWIVSYLIYRLIPGLTEGSFTYMYWIVYLLISVNVTSRIESHQDSNEHLFLYQYAGPVDLILSRIVFNYCYLILVSLFFYASLFLYFSHLEVYSLDFVWAILGGSFAVSTTLTFVTAVGKFADGQNTLMSIMSIPLLIPVVLILNRICMSIATGQSIEFSNILTLLGISLLSISLSLILFPFVWRR